MEELNTFPVPNDPQSLDSLALSSGVRSRLSKLDIVEAFPVQAAVIPHLLTHKLGDVCVCAPTGSGKTLAYALPIVESLSGRVYGTLRALIVLPTRDLALQVKAVFADLVKETDLTVCIVVVCCL